MSGAMAINKIISKLGYQQNITLADSLWRSCKEQLKKRALSDTIEHIESSTTGGLDTLEREDLYDALGEVLVGRAWPLNGEPDSSANKFCEALVKSLYERGFRAQATEAEGPSAH